MTDTPLLLPYDLEGVLVDVLKRRHTEHLAKLERLRALRPKTFEGFNTVVRMSDAQSLRLTGDTLPALLLGVIGAPQFIRNEDDGVDAVYQLGMQVTVMGKNRVDVLLRRDALAWTAIECMYQRVPRRGVVRSVQLMDYEPLSDATSQRTVGDARMVWEVSAANVLKVVGVPADDSAWPVEAGGAPEDPYQAPEDLPLAEEITFDLERKPIVS